MMGATTATSCAAFSATALLSPMAAMQIFGLLAAAALLAEYALVLTFYAAVLAIRGGGRSGGCGGCGGGGCGGGGGGGGDDHKDATSSLAFSSSSSSSSTAASASPSRASHRRTLPPSSRLSFWLREALLAPIRHDRVTLAVAGLFVLPFVGVSLAALAIDDQPLTFLDGRHPLQRVYLDSRDFAPSPLDEQAWVHLVWGLGDGALDTSALNLLRNRTSTGEPIRDADFALDAPAQRHPSPRARRCASPLVHPPLELVRGTAAVETVACWPEAFRAHLASRGKPFPSEDAAGDLLAWLGAELDADEAAGIAHAGDVGFCDDGTLAYVQLRAQTQLNQLFPHSAAHLRDEYTAWQALVGGLNAAAPPTMRRAVRPLSRSTRARTRRPLPTNGSLRRCTATLSASRPRGSRAASPSASSPCSSRRGRPRSHWSRPPRSRSWWRAPSARSSRAGGRSAWSRRSA